MYGTPSMSLGTATPCRCIVVGWLISLRTTIRTWFPCCTRISGPGTVPLNPIASTKTPGLVSQRTSSAVSSNTFVPCSTLGSRGSLPAPCVFAGNASTLARWPSSISWSVIAPVAPVMPAMPLAPVEPAGASPAPSNAMTMPTIPASACPGTVHSVR